MTTSRADDLGSLYIVGIYFLLGAVLHFTGGFFNGPSLLLLLGLIGVGTWRLTSGSSNTASDAVLALSLCAVSACFSSWAILNPRLMFAAPGFWLRVLQILIGFCTVGALVLCLLAVRGLHVSWIRPIASCIAASALFARASVIAVSPQPMIDVYSLTDQAAQFLLAGTNPYQQVYSNVYSQGALDPNHIFQYPPGYLLWASAFVGVLGDLRWNQVFAELATALAIFRISTRQIGQVNTPWLFVVAWLSFPVAYFVVEQAWTDPFIVALTAWLAVALQERRVLTAGVLVGILLVSKQYALFIGVTTAAWVYSHQRTGWKTFVVGALASVVGILAPFVISDWRSLYHATVEVVLATPVRDDGLTLQALALNQWSMTIPGWIVLAIDSSAGAFAWWLVTRARGDGLQEWAAATAMLYLVVFVTGPQAFCSYYFLDAFFVLLWLAFCGGAGRTVDTGVQSP